MDFEKQTTVSKTTVTSQTVQPAAAATVPVIVNTTAPLHEPVSPSACKEKHQHEGKGLFGRIKEVFTGGDNPVKNAEKYAKKVRFFSFSLCFTLLIF